MVERNRLLDLIGAPGLNGIDYVEVREAAPGRLWVHFLNAVPVAAPTLAATIVGAGGRTLALPPIAPTDWSEDLAGRPVLALAPPGAPDGDRYRLTLAGSPALDPYFAATDFSFLAFCPQPVDCRAPAPACPDDDPPAPTIDYLARDWETYRRALSDFSHTRVPEWVERSPADLGVTVMEALAAIGDDLAWLQDRIYHEAAIDTAQERRSLERLARLVDYTPRPLLAATTWLAITVSAPTVSLAAGASVSGTADTGMAVPFAIGRGLADTSTYPLAAAWNALTPYWWSDADRCLPPAGTGIDVVGSGLGLSAGQALILETDDPESGDPPRRTLVRLSAPPEEITDPVYGIAVTRLRWSAADAPRHWLDLRLTTIRGNVVPATQGETRTERFTVGSAPALERLAANAADGTPRWHVLLPLAADPLAWRPDGAAWTPELAVRQIAPEPRVWEWRRWLLDAGPFEETFAVEAIRYAPVLSNHGATTPYDIDGSNGATLRFGDGTLGRAPEPGDVFEIRYRTALGAAGNLAADSITQVDDTLAGTIVSLTNPFAASGGGDAETDDQIRIRAPQAFRTGTRRAVRSEDYDAALAQLPFVQRSGTQFRWTGSWPTVFGTVDPIGADTLDRAQLGDTVALLNRVRLAGYETYAPPPEVVPLELEIVVCARADMLAGDVHRAVDAILSPTTPGAFFHVDLFTLGTPLQRSRLEAAIHAVPGVAGLESIRYRRRGRTVDFVELPPQVTFAPGEIASVANDPARPGRGHYGLHVEGGR